MQITLRSIKQILTCCLFLYLLHASLALYESRRHYYLAELSIRNDAYWNMHPYLLKSLDALPLKTAFFFCKADLQRLHAGLGKSWHVKTQREGLNPLDFHAGMTQSLDHYNNAFKFGAVNLFTVRGAADTKAALEFSYARLFPEKANPYNALDLFERLIKVNPNGLESNIAFSNYLFNKEMTERLQVQAGNTARIYPSLGRLRKEVFFTQETQEAVRTGFSQALEQGIMPRTACFSLSAMAEKDRDFQTALAYYQKGLSLSERPPSAGAMLKLGILLLKTGRESEARNAFASALKKSASPSKQLRTIYAVFKRRDNLTGFIELLHDIEKEYLEPVERLLYLARAQTELKQPDHARKTLEKLNSITPDPRAYKMLADLARKEKDWDAMELAIQRATVLDPDNAAYFNILADVLVYQKKYRSAAVYMEKALKYDPGNPGYQAKLKKITAGIH